MLRFTRKAAPPDQGEASALAEALGISSRAAELLISRGLRDEASAYAFLHPSTSQLCDPFLLRDMEKAAARVKQAVGQGERIVIFGDYDADGICATATLLLYLRALGADADYLIPSRHEEGYGMNMQSANQLAQMGARLIITVDNGVKSAREIARCYELGMQAVVTDHHIPGEELPACEALVLSDGQDCYPNRHLCGAGLAFKLVEAIGGWEAAMEYISLAAVATVADIVPLTGENRALAALGLKAMNQGDCPAGLKALLDVSGSKAPLDTGHIAFRIAPRLNAAGRIEEAGASVDLLIQADPHKAKEAAARLDELNQLRRGEEAAIVDGACQAVEAGDLTGRRSIVLKNAGWNPGVVGIAASKLIERYHRPVVLLSESGGQLTGSARSIPGVNIHQALASCEDCFLRFGGHAYAAGLTMEAGRFEEFCRRLEEYLWRELEEEAFLPEERYDFETELSGVTTRLVKELAMLAPFGAGNPTPVLRTDGVRLANLARMGAEGRHLRMTAAKGEHYAPAVYFGAGDRFAPFNEMDRCDVVYVPKINDYYRREDLQLEIRKLRPAPPQDDKAWLAGMQGKFVDAFAGNIRYNRIRCDMAPAFVDAEDCARRFLEESAMGTLILCLTPGGAERFLRFVAAQGLWPRVDVTFAANEANPCAYNAAVLGPALAKMEPSRFRRVLFFDTPVTAGFFEEMGRRAPQGALFAGIPQPGDAEPLLAAMPAGRERMGALYKALMKTPGRFYNRASMLDSLMNASGAPRWECALAADVFEELGFVSQGKDGFKATPSPAPRELTESSTYFALTSLREMHDNFLHLYEEAHHEP